MTEVVPSRSHALKRAAIAYIHEHSFKSRVRRVAIPTAIASVVAGGSVTYAAATVFELATDYPTAHELAVADQIEPLVEDLQALVGGEGSVVATVDGEPNGFASLIVDDQQPAASLFWKGKVPTSVLKIIAAHPGITVTIVAADFSLEELGLARDLVAANLNDELDGDGALVRVGPDSKARGLKITVAAGPELTESELREAVARITDVPLVEIEISEDAGVTLF